MNLHILVAYLMLNEYFVLERTCKITQIKKFVTQINYYFPYANSDINIKHVKVTKI